MPHHDPFFEFDGAFVRISEIEWFAFEILPGGPHFVLALRSGKRFEHREYNGSGSELKRRLLEALVELGR